MKRAFITGITGQDGSYLAELLLGEHAEVHGLVRRSSSFNTSRIDKVRDQLHLHYGDITDAGALMRLVMEIKPDEIYNLAAQSHVRVSFDCPAYTYDTIANGTLHLLEAARVLNKEKPVRFYQASSSEMFGDVVETPQTELTPFRPQSPYACAKVCAHYQAVNYRKAYDMHVTASILHNHESSRRGTSFVTRKITIGAAKIYLGLDSNLTLGNLDAKRDWGDAREYVRAMRLMLLQDQPDDYVIATNTVHSVRDFARAAFGYLGMDYKKYVTYDARLERPSEVNLLRGDYSKAKRVLGWSPTTTFTELVRAMVDADVALLRKSPNS